MRRQEGRKCIFRVPVTTVRTSLVLKESGRAASHRKREQGRRPLQGLISNPDSSWTPPGCSVYLTLDRTTRRDFPVRLAARRRGAASLFNFRYDVSLQDQRCRRSSRSRKRSSRRAATASATGASTARTTVSSPPSPRPTARTPPARARRGRSRRRSGRKTSA